MINTNQMMNFILNNSKAMQNPLFANTMKLYKNGDSKGLEQMARNLCESKGISIDDIRKQIGI